MEAGWVTKEIFQITNKQQEMGNVLPTELSTDQILPQK